MTLFDRHAGITVANPFSEMPRPNKNFWTGYILVWPVPHPFLLIKLLNFPLGNNSVFLLLHLAERMTQVGSVGALHLQSTVASPPLSLLTTASVSAVPCAWDMSYYSPANEKSSPGQFPLIHMSQLIPPSPSKTLLHGALGFLLLLYA